MSIFQMLYKLLIGPLELLFEVIFSVANGFVQNPGFAIVFLSLAMNFLVLPLYKRADAMQEEQRQTEEKLRHWTSHIKKTFQGDERYMIMQTYYRQNHYKPTDALKGTTSLLLEIPFFMAAYNFLSGLRLLDGISFGPIQNLGAPDAMLMIAGVGINILPIAMTVINLISGAIYTKGMSLRSKIQLYGMALIFLVLLYDSPSGLVFYWTLNNLFSLCKNIFMKLKNPKKVLGFLFSFVGLLGLGYVLLVHPMASRRAQVMTIGALLCLQLPLAAVFASEHRKPQPEPQITGKDYAGFFLGGMFLTVLTGLLIPSGVIKTSPEEFIRGATASNPLMYVGSAFLLAAGTFLVWFGIFYLLANPSGKKIMGLAVWIFSGVALVDYMFFGTDYGNLSFTLKYDVFPVFSAKAQLLNLLVILAAAAVLFFIWRKREQLARAVYLTAGLALVVMSVHNLYTANSVLSQIVSSGAACDEEEPSLPLSKDGENVVVLMMDRAISAYLPYLFQENPVLQEQFAGFTYYPNTVSFGPYTNMGIPALFGGYEYTPEEMNRRNQERLVDKHNEALKVMPVLFDQAGYTVTVCDPSYAGYHFVPDLHIYDDYPDIRTFNIERRYGPVAFEADGKASYNLERNFFCYSLFKIAPVTLQPVLYARGTYNEADVLFANNADPMYTGQIQEGMSKAYGLDENYAAFHAMLEKLPELTQIQDSEENTFLMMTNSTTHDPVLLKVPEYEPAMVVDNTEYDAAHMERFTCNGVTLRMENAEQMMHYQINMAAMIQVGHWLDYLREMGVYDNTRIIIAADHGFRLGQLDALNTPGPDGLDLMFFNPLLMVKDFNSNEFTTSQTFMTNADVPTLAMDGQIANPVNPFTGKPINSEPKFAPELHLFLSTESNVAENNGKTFLPGRWIGFHGNLYDENNWRNIEDPNGNS